MKTKLILINTAISLLTLAAFAGQSPKDPLVHSIVIEAPVKDIWNAFTTGEGLESWMAASASIDLRVGGLMRTAYQKTNDLSTGTAIHNRILSFDPERMISIQCVRTPDKFPFKKSISKTWTNIYFEQVNANQTRVTSRMLGFDESVESVELRKFFVEGNQIELDALSKHFHKSK